MAGFDGFVVFLRFTSPNGILKASHFGTILVLGDFALRRPAIALYQYSDRKPTKKRVCGLPRTIHKI
jgi:hypothetical protein